MHAEHLKPAGVWIVAGTSWIYDGPSYVIPYANEVDAMRVANQVDYQRAYFVPFGVDLQDVMNAWPKAVGE